jgi:leucyl aminopeptidase
MAERAKKIAKDFGLSIDVLDQKPIEKLGMGSFLGVARGSDEPPKVDRAEVYAPKKVKSDGLLALVGKGITLIPAAFLSSRRKHGADEIRHDRCRHVMGTMRAIAS